MCFNPHSSFRPSATIKRLRAIYIQLKFQSSLELSPECNKLWAMVSQDKHLPFQSSLELSPECNGPILACVLDRVQGAVCANPPKKASDAGWGKVKGKRVFNVP